jgi:hypothetical protein
MLVFPALKCTLVRFISDHVMVGLQYRQRSNAAGNKGATPA